MSAVLRRIPKWDRYRIAKICVLGTLVTVFPLLHHKLAGFENLMIIKILFAAHMTRYELS